MHVFVAGATGAIGRPLVRALLADGHDVVALARSPANERAVRALGATPRAADILDVDSLARAAEGAAVVVRVATAIPLEHAPDAWSTNDAIRREGTRALVRAAARVGARLFAQESVAWVARPDDGAPFDETSKPNPDDTTRSALDAEVIATEEGARARIAVATLRLGWLYGPTCAHTRRFAHDLLRWRLPVVAGGRAPLSFLHADDAAAAFVAAVDRGRGGLWHVVDEAPASTRAFFDGLADAVGAPRPMSVPEWVARFIAGDANVRFLTTPMVTSNALAKADLGWRPRHATIEDGLRHVGAAWHEDDARAQAPSPIAR